MTLTFTDYEVPSKFNSFEIGFASLHAVLNNRVSCTISDRSKALWWADFSKNCVNIFGQVSLLSTTCSDQTCFVGP